jgi:hypothetical protein
MLSFLNIFAEKMAEKTGDLEPNVTFCCKTYLSTRARQRTLVSWALNANTLAFVTME